LVAEPLLLPSTLDARFDADDRTVIVETRGGELRSFRLTRTVPLCAAQTDEIPKRTPPLPVADIVGIAATNFHADDITSFQFSPDGKLLATASKDNTACLWEMRPLQPSNGPLHRLKHSEIVNCVRFAPNGERIVTSTSERKVRVWDTRTGLPLTDWLVFNERVVAVEFSSDGKRIITDMGWSWELHLTSGPAPEWLRLLAGAIADSSETSAAQGLLTLRRELPRRPDAEAGWAKRLLEVQ